MVNAMVIHAPFQNCLTFEHLLSPHILSSHQIANVKKFTWMEWQEIDVVTNNFNLVKTKHRNFNPVFCFCHAS